MTKDFLMPSKPIKQMLIYILLFSQVFLVPLDIYLGVTGLIPAIFFILLILTAGFLLRPFLIWGDVVVFLYFLSLVLNFFFLAGALSGEGLAVLLFYGVGGYYIGRASNLVIGPEFISIVRWMAFFAICLMVLLLILSPEHFLFNNNRFVAYDGLQYFNIRAFLGDICAAALLSYFVMGKKIEKNALYLSGIFILFLLVAMYFLAALVSIFAAIIVILLLKTKLKKIIISYISFGILLLLLPLLLIFLPQMVENIVAGNGGDLVPVSWLQRLILLRAASDVFLAHPFFGIGLFNYQNYLTDNWSLYQTFLIGNPSDPHNIIAQSLCETGLFGFSIFLYLFFMANRKLDYLTRTEFRVNAEVIQALWLYLFIKALVSEGLISDFKIYIVAGLIFALGSLKTKRNKALLSG